MNLESAVARLKLKLSDGSGGTKQAVALTLSGTVSTSGNILLSLSSSVCSTSVSVAVLLGDTAADACTKARAALMADTGVLTAFKVSAVGTNLILTRLEAADNDSTMLLTMTNVDAAGLEPAVSVITAKGSENGTGLTNEELENEIVDAAYRHDPDLTYKTVPKPQEYLVIMLAWISCLYTLAARNALEYRVSIEGISVAKSERVAQYLNTAAKLEEQYQKAITNPNYNVIEVEEMQTTASSIRHSLDGRLWNGGTI